MGNNRQPTLPLFDKRLYMRKRKCASVIGTCLCSLASRKLILTLVNLFPCDSYSSGGICILTIANYALAINFVDSFLAISNTIVDFLSFRRVL